MKHKPTKEEIMQVLYENRVAFLVIAILVLLAIIGQVQQSTPEMR